MFYVGQPFESFLGSQGGRQALLEMEARIVHVCYTLCFLARLTASPAHGSEPPALHGIGSQAGTQTFFTAPFQFPMDLGMLWLLILSFHFCSPSALGSWQMIFLLFTPVCPHTLSLCVFSFQTIFNGCPSQPLRASPNSNQLVQPNLL